ncbi:Aste57867_22103 [Aphanomyces stellatus]|uniref:Aste57867_22103 protein n=1 Tax=Aphanomyces stellatus TaxID=120398 RepID=A0A485LK37_9STRA|nr:hypothetical protein As57867_022034 [Aphanomyces stellatus]VFT98771.1 Aste57867_22103 [Aphanomyces stellatus]
MLRVTPTNSFVQETTRFAQYGSFMSATTTGNLNSATWLMGILSLSQSLCHAGYLIQAQGGRRENATSGREATHASNDGNLVRVLGLLDKGVQNLEWRGGEDGQTTLVLASGWGHIDIVKALVNHGVTVDGVDSIGRTALLCVSHQGHVVIVEELIARGANVDIASKVLKY